MNKKNNVLQCSRVSTHTETTQFLLLFALGGNSVRFSVFFICLFFGGRGGELGVGGRYYMAHKKCELNALVLFLVKFCVQIR